MSDIAEYLCFVENGEEGITCSVEEVKETSRKEANKMSEIDMNILKMYYVLIKKLKCNLICAGDTGINLES